MAGVHSAPRADRAADDRFLDHLSSAAEMVGVRRFREAEVEVLRALSIEPSDPRGLKLLALIRFKLGRLDEALALCRDLAAVAPRDPGLRLKMGLIALKLDRVDEAIEELELAADLAPMDLRAWSYLGFACARRGERARAAAAFRRAGAEALAVEMETEAEAQAEPGELEWPPSGPEALAARADVFPGALPGASFEPALEISAPIMAPAPRVAASPPVTDSPSSEGLLPATSLVGYAVSRLGPPLDRSAWLGAAARVAIGDGAFVRGDAAVACAGRVRWEEAHRRVRGRPTAERLGRGDTPFFRVQGPGELFVAAPAGRLVPLQLEDDVLYVREDAVAAFEGTVSWEYGHIPRGPLGMLQFRGRGLVAICVRGEIGAVKVTPDRPVQVTARYLLGWVGRVVARGGRLSEEAREGDAPGLPGPLPVTCEGEGVVLFDVEREGGRSE